MNDFYLLMRAQKMHHIFFSGSKLKICYPVYPIENGIGFSRFAIGLSRAARLSVFLERIVRWAAEALFALTTMTACSQRVELRAA